MRKNFLKRHSLRKNRESRAGINIAMGTLQLVRKDLKRREELAANSPSAYNSLQLKLTREDELRSKQAMLNLVKERSGSLLDTVQRIRANPKAFIRLKRAQSRKAKLAGKK